MLLSSRALHYYNAQDKWQDDHNLLALGYSTLPFVLCVIVVQRYAQVGTVVGRVGAAPEHTMHRVDGTAVDAAVCGRFALVQAAQQDI